MRLGFFVSVLDLDLALLHLSGSFVKGLVFRASDTSVGEHSNTARWSGGFSSARLIRYTGRDRIVQAHH
jgi:hypothetical protein